MDAKRKLLSLIFPSCAHTQFEQAGWKHKVVLADLQKPFMRYSFLMLRTCSRSSWKHSHLLPLCALQLKEVKVKLQALTLQLEKERSSAARQVHFAEQAKELARQAVRQTGRARKFLHSNTCLFSKFLATPQIWDQTS